MCRLICAGSQSTLFRLDLNFLNLWDLYLCILVSECLFQDPKLHTDEAPAAVPQHMDTTLGLYYSGSQLNDIGSFLQNAVAECQSLQNGRSSTFYIEFIPIRAQIPEKEDVDMCGKLFAPEARRWLFVVQI